VLLVTLIPVAIFLKFRADRSVARLLFPVEASRKIGPSESRLIAIKRSVITPTPSDLRLEKRTGLCVQRTGTTTQPGPCEQ
jgi:hypothetical protein